RLVRCVRGEAGTRRVWWLRGSRPTSSGRTKYEWLYVYGFARPATGQTFTVANDSTSLLTSPELVGELKTRAMARWAEQRGFRTRVVERLFPGGMNVAGDEPRLLLGGVDNALARAAYEDAGFDCVVEAGLGAGPSEY